MSVDIQKGDIIYVVRTPLSHEDKKVLSSYGLSNLVTYRHYGIAVDNFSVIHFLGTSGFFSGDVTIRHTSMNEFARGGDVEVDSYAMREIIFTRDNIVERARSKVGSTFGGYHLIKNNCEHFAYWAATDKKISRQELLVSNNSEQDFVSNLIDRGTAYVDKAFDPLINAGDKIDKALGIGDHRNTSDTVGERITRFFKSW